MICIHYSHTCPVIPESIFNIRISFRKHEVQTVTKVVPAEIVDDLAIFYKFQVNAVSLPVGFISFYKYVVAVPEVYAVPGK